MDETEPLSDIFPILKEEPVLTDEYVALLIKTSISSIHTAIRCKVEMLVDVITYCQGTLLWSA